MARIHTALRNMGLNKIGFIYVNDIRGIVRNWAALVIVLGLAVLPSLYAWFNIEASWDPYGRTGELKVAVVNKDKSATLRGTPINIGEEIIASLQRNHAIGWVFTDERQALQGVEHGRYYASITIPENFSARISTVLSDIPEKAVLVYTVNEKINAIAPKITAQGAKGVINEVNHQFTKTASDIIFRIFNELGIGLESNLPDIVKIRDAVFNLESIIPELNQTLDIIARDASIANERIRKLQSNLPIVTELAKEGTDFAQRLGEFLDHSSAVMDEAAPAIKLQLALLQQTANAAASLTDILRNDHSDLEQANQTLTDLSQRLTAASDRVGKLISLFERLTPFSKGSLPLPVTDKLREIEDRFNQQRKLVDGIAKAIDQGAQPADKLIDELNRIAGESSDALGNILDRYDEETTPRISQAIDHAKQNVAKTRTLLADANEALPDVERMVADAAKLLDVGEQKFADLKQELPEAESKVGKLADRIRELEKMGSLDELIDLLKNNNSLLSDFFANPIVLEEKTLFPIPNYGSAMSPFFTTLSLWVGALLLVSLLTVEIHHPDVPYRSYQVYFGRFLSFLTIALLQSLLVTLGDMWLLRTYVLDKLWFIVFGLLLSAVFMLIVYTLVSVFGNVGKAMSIVLLVLQLAGSGGTFPIEVTPAFFQAIHPFLPFTYGISMMREAVGGILWDIVRRDLLAMAAFAATALFVGLALKDSINRISARFVRKARESKLIH
ncbi:hypothetical protein PAT3040_01585 [Paenibacillus agaridevorans]|uniref:ABC-2 type transporter transmembrane domain-containing protein n=1 Tax=Paenibacillus agaridevorans TaxID=171404 RepID=A0A2R5EKH0_9BACL|nr:YhgE/Pip domain-containing protein [Paenibacillus agaridevorans]GBG07037.1 hypothetical protein PAT3040_01585 [Paenibacillus agaridevorans]